MMMIVWPIRSRCLCRFIRSWSNWLIEINHITLHNFDAMDNVALCFQRSWPTRGCLLRGGVYPNSRPAVRGRPCRPNKSGWSLVSGSWWCCVIRTLVGVRFQLFSVHVPNGSFSGGVWGCGQHPGGWRWHRLRYWELPDLHCLILWGWWSLIRLWSVFWVGIVQLLQLLPDPGDVIVNFLQGLGIIFTVLLSVFIRSRKCPVVGPSSFPHPWPATPIWSSCWGPPWLGHWTVAICRAAPVQSSPPLLLLLLIFLINVEPHSLAPLFCRCCLRSLCWCLRRSRGCLTGLRSCPTSWISPFMFSSDLWAFGRCGWVILIITVDVVIFWICQSNGNYLKY